SFRLLKGNPENALTERYSIVLTEGMVDKYFENEEPMGKLILIAGTRTAMTVTGVMENIPQNSHMQFDFIIPIENMDYWWSEDFKDWGRMRFNAYVQLLDNVSGEEFSDKISDIVKQHHPETGITRTWLQPLRDVHFNPVLSQDIENFGKSNIIYIYALSILAAILLLIACINYMNLSTARSVYRSKEIGVRKVTGAYRSDIIKQVFTESIISSGIAVLFSLILLYFSLPLFSEISGKQFSFGSLDKLYILFILIGIGTTSCLLSGSYPAFVLSAHKPLAILKKAVNKEDFRDVNLRKILVITQFSFSLIFIIGTFVIYDQLDFIRNKDLGYNKDHIIYFRGPRGDFESRPDVIKNELLQNPNVLSVTYAYPPRSLSWYTTDVSWEGKDPLNDYLMNVQPGDYDFLNTFDIELVEGRYFSKDFPGDESNYLLSETAVRVLGIESPVGKRFTYRGELQSENPEGKIIGVVKDYHLGSLHNELKPILIKYNSPFPYICAKLSPDNISETIGFFENKWKEFGEDRPFSYTFLDETISDFYRNERKIGQVFKYFTVIAVFIAFIGLFGLTIFMTEQRTKEIGVRKVLGATVKEIVLLLSRDFLKLIIISALIACPIGWILMNRWLQDFAYRVDIGLGIFVFSFMLSLIIMFVTVSYQTIKAALTNPVESLRYE
ncbi:MAG: FtsX-like permease family protein, partial [bacterium]|nr:FtsX-like permease family protein [bacterium]